MKPFLTTGKKNKTNIKLGNIKLNVERGERIIVSSLSDLKRKENLEELENFSFIDFSLNTGEFGGSYLFNAVVSDKEKLKYRFIGLSEKKIEDKLKKLKKEGYTERKIGVAHHIFNYLYFFDDDRDGNPPTVQKVLKITDAEELSFFVNTSYIHTGDFLEDSPVFTTRIRPSDYKVFKIKDLNLVFCCIPDYEDGFGKTKFTKTEIKKFSSNMDLFIKDRVKKKKLVKFKVPNGVYGIYPVINDNYYITGLSDMAEPEELLGHYIKKIY